MTKRSLVAITIVMSLSGCKFERHRADNLNTVPYRGTQWLAWQTSEQDNFVSAYIDGYESGAHAACNAADGLFDLKPGPAPEHDKDEIVLASGVCHKHVAHYSKFKPSPGHYSDVSAYTAVLTKFYAEHPEYLNIPYEYLMQYLTDEANKNADDLYRMAGAGEIRTSW